MEPEYVVLAGGACDGEIHGVPPGSASLTRHLQRGGTCWAEEFERGRGLRVVAGYGWLSVMSLTRTWLSYGPAGTRRPDRASSTEPRMQHRVQAAILRAAARHPAIDRDALRASVPGADERDLERALEILVRSGAVTVDLRSSTPRLRLTSMGEELLLTTA